MRGHLTICLLTLTLTFVGCKTIEADGNYEVSKMPEKFSVFSESERRLKPWWLEYKDQELSSLVKAAIGSNLTLKESAARLRAAEQVARIAGAQRKGSVGYSAGTTHGRQRTELAGEFVVEDYSLGLSGSYEIDLWGKLKASVRAAEYDMQASREDLKTAAMTVTARIAETWLNLIGQKKQLQLLKAQLASNQKVLELLEFRMKNTAKTSLVDVLQQRQTVASVRRRMPLVEASIAVLQNELAVLLGKAPQEKVELKAIAFPVMANLPQLGIPADLLSNRPDVVAAGLRLRADDWRVAVAKADRLPSLSLSATYRLASGDIKTILDQWLLTLGASVAGPIFDGGRRDAEVERTRAVVTQRTHAYHQTVLDALKEVEDALVREHHQRRHVEEMQKEIELVRQTRRESELRYMNGAADYLPVLSAIIKLQALEQDLISKQLELHLYRVALYRALGGAWLNDVADAKEIQR